LKISKECLELLETRISFFELRRIKSPDLLSECSGNEWNFALLFVTSPLNIFSFGDMGTFRAVFKQPSEAELKSALKFSFLSSHIESYTRGISYELSINRGMGLSDRAAFNLAFWIISAIRIRTLAEFLVPLVADYSWSTFATLKNKQCSVDLLENFPLARRVYHGDIWLDDSVFEWVSANLMAFGKMLENPKFSLAVEALTTHNQNVNLRMMVASLWAGLEALFDINIELRFRLAMYIASIIESRGVQRTNWYKKIKNMYDIRSKVVHGVSMENVDLEMHILEIRQVLSGLLCRIVEDEEMFTEEYIEKRLLE